MQCSTTYSAPCEATFCWQFFIIVSHLTLSLSAAYRHGDVTALSPLFQGVTGVTRGNPSYLSGRRQDTPWTSLQLITGPLLMAEAHQENFWGSVSCLRIHGYAAQFRPRGAGPQPPSRTSRTAKGESVPGETRLLCRGAPCPSASAQERHSALLWAGVSMLRLQ